MVGVGYEMTDPGVDDGRLLRRRLKELIVEACQVRGVEPEEVPDDAPLINGPGPLELDSLDALEIAMALRREFGIEIENVGAAAEAFQSVSTLADFVRSNARSVEARNLPSA